MKIKLIIKKKYLGQQLMKINKEMFKLKLLNKFYNMDYN